VCVLLVLVTVGPLPWGAAAKDLDGPRLPGQVASLAPAPGPAKAVVTLTVAGRATVARSDFTLAAGGDMFGVERWNAVRSHVVIAPRRSRTFRLTFGVPSRVARRGALYYRGARSRVMPLGRSPASAVGPTVRRSAAGTVVNTFPLTPGVGDPWGTAIDRTGSIWFAEPGCDFAPKCDPATPPGQLGQLVPSTRAVKLYTLPGIPGNQPLFLAFDDSGNLWFTTPNNDMIGEFSPASGTFIGQWPVTPGSGPWDLTFASGQLWYTQHLASAVGAFDPVTHSHQDFQTPSANSNPYGIAADSGLVWFTENNSSVDRVAVLDTTHSGAITEYQIVQPLSGGTPHLIAVGAGGHPWWTEGWTNTIATLDPAVATPGTCGIPTPGACKGVQRFQVPRSTTCGGDAHTSGIAFDSAADRVWISNSLTSQVGSFTPSTGSFDMTTLSNCAAHPHDGLNLDGGGNVWFDEQFANALGELVPPKAPGAPPTGTPPTGTPPATTPPPGPIAGVAPVNTSPPTVHGTTRQGRTLLAQTGSWTNQASGFEYTWQRCFSRCVDIAGASGSAYKLGARDVDARVRVVVTARNNAGSAHGVSRSVGPVGPSRTRVRIALARLLADSPEDLRAAQRHDRYAGWFTTPSRGSLTLSWRAHHVHLALERQHFAKGGGARIVVPLSDAGERLLRRSKRFLLVAKAVFKPVGERAATRLERFRLTVR
jgi:streptogramin lyase